MTTTCLYDALRDAGVPLDHHESDLYAKVTPDSTRLVKAFGTRPTIFTNAQDGTPWYDCPFAYQPYWDAVRRRVAPHGEPEEGYYDTDIMDDGDR